LWKDFDGKIGRTFSEWLRSVGQLETPTVGKEDELLAKKVQANLNRIFDLPDLRELELDPFQSSGRRRTPLPDSAGDLLGREVIGQQLVEGTYAGAGEGQKVPALGEQPGTSLLADQNGSTRITEQERIIRTGVRIRILPFPNRLEPSWMDPAEEAVIVNASHPAFLCARATGGNEFYIIATCFQLLSNLREDEAERQTVQTRLFEAYLAVSEDSSRKEIGDQ